MKPLRYRSKLFVHGSERETYEPAFATAADSVVLNNEDHVDEDMKDISRRWIVEFLDQPEKLAGKLIQVRANEVGSPFFKADIEAFVHPSVDIINLTKIETPEQVHHADAMISELEAERQSERPISLLITIESPVGLRRAHEIARCRRVVGLQIGYGDLLRPLGIDFRGPGADTVRLLVRMAAAEGGDRRVRRRLSRRCRGCRRLPHRRAEGGWFRLHRQELQFLRPGRHRQCRLSGSARKELTPWRTLPGRP